MKTAKFNAVVLQPITLCNLDCTYCYLPSRRVNHRMSVDVVQRVAMDISMQESEEPTSLIWHGGEPTAGGEVFLRKLIGPFERLRCNGRVQHHIQSNGTLINRGWCDFFKEFDFKVGISIDGDLVANRNRVDLSGRNAFPMIMRGIEQLKRNGIPFTTIAVVTRENMERVEEFYEFFLKLGCKSLGINIEEREGVNLERSTPATEETREFWRRLFALWHENPLVLIREFDLALRFIDLALQNNERAWFVKSADLFPTVGWNGDVFLLSPEFAGSESERYHNFVVGNVLTEPLAEILSDAETHHYVTDFIRGVALCKQSCPYFDFCLGGDAANKYYEHGSTCATETTFCLNSKQIPIDTILEFQAKEKRHGQT